MKHAQFCNPHGRHVTQCGRDVTLHVVVPLDKFVALAIYPDRHKDLCLDCCASIQAIGREYRAALGDVHREAYDVEVK